LSDIESLKKLAQNGFELIKTIDKDCTHGLKVGDTFHYVLFDTIMSQFQSMESVALLIQSNKFKDSFIVLRPVFEMLLYFWLMVEGKKYRFTKTFTIIPKSDSTKKDSRDNTFEKWQAAKKAGDPSYKEIVSMQKQGEDKIKVNYIHEGLYESKDEKKKGPVYPNYTFVITDHYDQSLRFNAELPSIKVGDMFPDITEDNIRTQKQIYHHYIYFKSIVENLVLNNLITLPQKDYILVHYNFLSNYVHPSLRSIRQFTKGAHVYRQSEIPDYIVIEQLWLYICRMQYLFLKTIVNKFESENTKANLGMHKKLILELESKTNYFWFFDNEPTHYDKWVSEGKKQLVAAAQKIKPEDLAKIDYYYENPLERLHQLKNWIQR